MSKIMWISLGVVTVIASAIGIYTYKNRSQTSPPSVVNTSSTPTSSATATSASTPTPSPTNTLTSWQFNGTKWASNQTPPACPTPITLPTPVDLKKATAVLYPGQYRGEYKPHGGFIFRNYKNEDISVTNPLDATVYKGSRYIEQGETQYFFVFTTNCGIAYRFDHLLTLSPALQKLADTLPAALPNDSRTTIFNDAPQVKAGEVLATAVGFKKNKNVSVDFGVYDLRQQNAVSKTAAWQSKHSKEIEFGAYAICWLDNLPAADSVTAKALPGGDDIAGKQSDYCQ